jgi:hypothetical protein
MPDDFRSFMTKLGAEDREPSKIRSRRRIPSVEGGMFMAEAEDGQMVTGVNIGHHLACVSYWMGEADRMRQLATWRSLSKRSMLHLLPVSLVLNLALLWVLVWVGWR